MIRTVLGMERSGYLLVNLMGSWIIFHLNHHLLFNIVNEAGGDPHQPHVIIKDNRKNRAVFGPLLKSAPLVTESILRGKLETPFLG
jgi:hypothetical protein